MLDSIGGSIDVLKGIIETMEEEDTPDNKRAMHMAALESVVMFLDKLDDDLFKKGINA